MKLFAILIVFLIEFASRTESGNNWALLVAGSKGFCNYRHQADVSHAYQVLHKNGIPDERIVVMMYDDIAWNVKNPSPGVIQNVINGPNVYKGVLKDYTSNNVTAEVFYAVLNGDKAKVKELTGADGKVIESGPDDNVFLFYSDHGAIGLLRMPTGRHVKAKELNDIIKRMHAEGRFNQMLIYLDACHSGSMFDKDLPNDINVYAATAAPPKTDSYACCYDKKIGTFLGDVFSVTWMDDTEMADIFTRTLDAQFQVLVKKSKKSKAQRYGMLSMKSDTLSLFMSGNNDGNATGQSEGLGPSMNIELYEDLLNDFNPGNDSKKELKFDDTVASQWVPITILRRELERTPQNSHLRTKLERDLEQMETSLAQTYDLFWQIATFAIGERPRGDNFKLTFDEGQSIENYACYDQAVDLLSDVCSEVDTNINSLFLRNFYVMVNLCNHQPTEKVLYAVKYAARSSPLCYSLP